MQDSQITPRGTGSTAMLVAFMIAHGGHHLCTAATVPLLPMIRDTFGLDYARSGLLLAAFTLSYGFVQLPAAALSDRVSKRALVSLGLLGTGAACIGIAAAADYTQLLLSLVLMGVTGSTYHAPTSALISATFGKEGRGRALGIHMMGGAVGFTSAPIVAVLIANATGNWRNSFSVLGIPILLAGALVWTLARAQEGALARSAAVEQPQGIDLRQVLRAVGLLAALAMPTHLLVGGANSYLPLYFVDRHGMPADVAGLMMAVLFGGGLLGGPLGGALSDRMGRKPVMLLYIASVGPLIYLMTMVPAGVALALLIAVYGAVIAVRFPTMESMIADVVPAHRRATALGGYYFLAQEGSGLFTPVLGWMIDQFGIGSGFFVLSLATATCSLLAVLLWRKV